MKLPKLESQWCICTPVMSRAGQPVYRAEVYGRIIAGIRSFSRDLIVCVSLSGRNFTQFEQRAEPLQLSGDLKPDMGSLTLSSLNFNNVASVNAPDMVQKLASEMKSRGIVPELEAFDAGMINYAKYLQKKGLLKPPHYFNLLLGNIACAQADLLHAGIMMRSTRRLCLVSSRHRRRSVDDEFNRDCRRRGSQGGTGGQHMVRPRANSTRHERELSSVESTAWQRQMSVPIMSPVDLRHLLSLRPGYGEYGRDFE